MARLSVIQTDKATGKAKELLEAVQTKLSMTPSMTRVMANSPYFNNTTDVEVDFPKVTLRKSAFAISAQR